MVHGEPSFVFPACIGDPEPKRIPLNRPSGTFSPSGGEGWDEGVRFMESLVSLATVHWDREPVWGMPSVWCPAFRRPGPAKARTPNTRFVESPLSLLRIHWDGAVTIPFNPEPTP